MQKFISKYGLAAHLAFAAVAPLPLSGLVSEAAVATVLLWLSGAALIWMFLSPSVFAGESLRHARSRMTKALLRDPLMWVMLFLVVAAGVRALNGGIKMAYDAEEMQWSIADAVFPLLPGTVDGHGYLPFATAVLAFVAVSACRHALGKAARLGFFFMAAVLAGVNAFARLVLGFEEGSPVVGNGFIYGIYLLVGTVALSGAFEYRWNKMMPFFVFAIGFTAAGTFAYSSPLQIISFLAAESVLLGYCFFHAHATMRKAAEFKLLVAFGLSIAVGVFAALSLLPESLMSDKISAILSWKLFSEEFSGLRSVLSEIAFRSWKVHPWLGSGLASFSLDVRFFATDSDWMTLVSERAAALNGYWHLLAERGIVGAALLALPLILLLVYFSISCVRGVMAFRLPHPAAFAGVLILAVVAADAFFGVSFLSSEVMAAVVFSLAVSAKSFPKEKSDG